ncbi:dTMP kinase [Parvibaculum lavamentivorans DS-1]|uniref:Thymidylate kinase n=1 Tax=Parvibaculum lavamentivorans (strain DS-1 / DSM 13023 / NCIMB 13966) TaxID=402881 RepID=A7HXT4_PARL1|nr:dTMP kinase [Parvibaculum lavamentivorans]ABS64717.1 dTMP kinase [Parvibaculum lavamentivorans DS-1]
MPRARFITLEGGEGAGKSTQVRRLAARLEAAGQRVTITREPGGAPGAEAIRHLLVTGDVARWTPKAEMLLHFAAREDHLSRTIRPALERGDWVICDRFVDSTMAYQGFAQGLGPELVNELKEIVIGDDMPGLTLILDLPVETGLARAGSRGQGAEDRYERMDLRFHETLRQAFETIAKNEPERCVMVDASQTEDEVAEAIWAEVKPRLS